MSSRTFTIPTWLFILHSKQRRPTIVICRLSAPALKMKFTLLKIVLVTQQMNHYSPAIHQWEEKVAWMFGMYLQLDTAPSKAVCKWQEKGALYVRIHERWSREFGRCSCGQPNAPELDQFHVMVVEATLVWGATGLESQVSDKLMKLHMSDGGKADMLGYNLAFVDLAQKIKLVQVDHHVQVLEWCSSCCLKWFGKWVDGRVTTCDDGTCIIYCHGY